MRRLDEEREYFILFLILEGLEIAKKLLELGKREKKSTIFGIDLAKNILKTHDKSFLDSF